MNQIKQVALTVLSFFFESKARFVLFLVLLLLPLAMGTKLLQDSHPSSFTVMVTRMDEQSGGSGSVVYSSRDKSVVLTNAHVCDVLNKKGGLVKKEDGTKYMVTAYKKSEFHDLCAVWVAADLGQTVNLADKSPKSYTEAIITGHPALLPNIINKGSFGERKIVEIMVGIKECTKQNIKTEEDAVLCFLIGGIPVIKTYESVVVSAMIMAGSSGSAVLDQNGKLAGVVFAGQGGGLSYAFVVPYEYVSIFINEELKVPTQLTRVPLEGKEAESHEEVLEAKRKLLSECKKDNKVINKICATLSTDIGQ